MSLPTSEPHGRSAVLVWSRVGLKTGARFGGPMPEERVEDEDAAPVPPDGGPVFSGEPEIELGEAAAGPVDEVEEDPFDEIDPDLIDEDVVRALMKEARDLRDALARAEDRAEKAEKEVAYKAAEAANVRRRGAQDVAAVRKYAGMVLARRMVGVLDDLQRALGHAEAQAGDGADDDTVVQGLRMVRDRLWQELEADGVTLVDAEGATFDPEVHEALTTVPVSDEHPANTIVSVLEPGYRYADRLLRAARVVVASEHA